MCDTIVSDTREPHMSERTHVPWTSIFMIVANGHHIFAVDDGNINFGFLYSGDLKDVSVDDDP